MITDLKAQKGRGYVDVLTQAIRGGATVVQLRDQEASDETLIALGRALRKICDHFGTLLIVNDRIDVAQAIDADGLHVGQNDMPLSEVKERLGSRKWVGISTHSLVQAKKAVEEGADYIGVGPVFKTPTKPGYPPVGVELVREVRSHLEIPFVAIGGIDLGNVKEVLLAGADSVAVVRAVVGQDDICEAARKFKTLLNKWPETSGEEA